MYINHKSQCKCPFCKSKRGENTGEYNGNYRNAKTTKKYCIDCSKELVNYTAKRCKSCANKNRKGKEHYNVGKNHPNWNNGSSFEPYSLEFNSELKESIRKRDNHQCQLCNMTEEEHIIVYGQVLDVHHIDYNKTNCEKENLMSLCKQCNSRVNFNRDYWKEYFKIIMEKIKER